MNDISEHDRIPPPPDDDEARREYGRQLAMDALLVHALSGKAGRVFLPSAKAPSILLRSFLPLAAAAVLVLCVYGVTAWQAGEGNRAVMGRITEVRGQESEVRQSGKESWTRVKPGDMVHVGNEVRVGPDGYVKFSYPDGSEIEVREDTNLVLDAGRRTRWFGLIKEYGGKRIRLDAGRLNAQISKQRTDRPMVLATPHASLTVIGTRFDLLEKEDRTQLRVKHGTIHVAEASGGREIDVTGGHFVEAGPGIEMKARPMRVEDGLLALYVFDEGAGTVIRDLSGAGEPADLKISNPGLVEWKPNEIRAKAGADLVPNGNASKIAHCLKKNKALTIELWLRVSDMNFTGDTQYVYLDIGHRSIMVKAHSTPEAQEILARTGLLEHPVFTFRMGDDAQKVDSIFYANGNPIGSFKGTDLLPADGTLGLRFFQGGPTRGGLFTCYMIAIYDRMLTHEEVKRNHAAGLDAIRASIVHRTAQKFTATEKE